ncbi:MAG: N-acetylmuramoyl-L-alanine amidase [Bacteroidetes bacterium]|uniref:N-acetylmuramoyl-L-alanine amidase n=1 Tax=Candidatus Cryptobacteroides excrementipullorum TaxID=2840761 RepID=A0A9D9IUB2_9BACT|nr:N-acetylmuramoyl-L-alanine amidase [Candidatus Cryptobacteroides excrementipullorum]
MSPKYIIAAIWLITAGLFTLSDAAAQTAGQTKPRLNTVVIDPGHGGKDAGCVSKDGRTYEKNLTLSIAKQLGQKIKEEYPEVKVYYTRLTDRYITLNERADIANRNHADLFISIHINANTSTSPSGFSAHIFGRSSGKDSDLFRGNMELCRRENSVILLEDDYSTNYQGFDPEDPESFIFFNLMQNAFYEQSLLFAGDVIESLSGGPIAKNRGVSQDPFFVLWKTSMPSVLLELGFISNAADLKVLNSEKGRSQIASRLFTAFRKFKTKYDSSLDYSSTSIAPAGAVSGKEPEAAGMHTLSHGVMYGIQIMATSRDLPEDDRSFKGYKALEVKSGDIYKYIVEVSSSEQEPRAALKAVGRKFPGAFLVKIEDGKVSRL